MSEKIDIYCSEAKFERAKRLVERENFCEEDRKNILQFLEDCKDGKTNKNTAKKKVGFRRLARLAITLRQVTRWLGKPLKEVTQADLEKVTKNIDDNAYKKNRTVKNKGKDSGFEIISSDENYGEYSKIYLKKSFKKFNKWLSEKGINKGLDCSFMETYVESNNDFDIIDREEMEKLLEYTPKAMWKALQAVLWDGGFRVEELLNIRLRHVEKPKNDPSSFNLRVIFSKTKYGIRTVPLYHEKAILCLQEWLVQHPDKGNPEAQLFPIEYGTLKKFIKRAGNIVLKKKITPYSFRHSCATHYAGKLTHYQLCDRMGWCYSSKMPDVYIKRANISDLGLKEKVKGFEITEAKKDSESLKEEVKFLKQNLVNFNDELKRIAGELDKKTKEDDFLKKILKKMSEKPEGLQHLTQVMEDVKGEIVKK